MSTKLSEHFSLEEMLVTQVRDVENEPQGAAKERVLAALAELAQGLERVRALLGNKPVIVTSGYRSMLVNRIVGGSPSSAHMRGWAADFICPGFGSPFEVCQAIEGSVLEFDQLIYEESWVHLSFDPRMRMEVLSKRKHGAFVSGLRE